MEPLDQEQGDQGCPNLDAQGIFAGADESLDAQRLLERLEDDLDLPAFLVDCGNHRGAKLPMIAQQRENSLIDLIPNDNPAQVVGAFLLGSGPGQANPSIGEDVSAFGKGPLFEDCKHGVVLEAGDEEDALAGPGAEQAGVVVATIRGDDRSGIERQQPRSRDIMPPGLADVHERGQIPIVVERYVTQRL